MLPITIIRLIHVMSSLLIMEPQEPYNTLLSEIIDNYGNLNYEALTFFESVLAQNGKMDLVELIQRTMTEDYSLLEVFENHLQYRRQFQESYHHPGRQFPEIYYRYTTNNNPVCQESGNVQGDTQNEERYGDEQSHEPIMPGLFEQLGHSPPEEPRQRRGRKVSPSAQRGRDNALPSHGNHERTDESEPNVEPARSQIQPLMSVRCRNCKNDLNVIKTSSNIWRRIDDIMRKLSVDQIHHFMDEVNKYDNRILNYAEFQHETPLDIVPDIIRALRTYNLQDEKCVLCLLAYMFQRIGRSDLADEVKEIRQMRWQ